MQQPRYPIYIVSKGRASTRFTARSLEKLGIDYFICVEPQEYDEYAAVIDSRHILTLPFSNLGQGSIPARNFAWEHSISNFASKRHWVLDDNIKDFYRLKANKRVKVHDSSTFCEAEDFVDRYSNVALAGMNYTYLVKQGEITNAWDKPFLLNSRIYSCILIQNDIPFRWRGRYNEDTDLSLRVLKAGYCTILFEAYLCGKVGTMTMKGGNTDELYAGDGRKEMALSLQRQHPDVTRVVFKWGRWQHSVNYSRFRANRLKYTPEYEAQLSSVVGNAHGQ